MQIGWVVPCENIFYKLRNIVTDVRKINWQVHIFCRHAGHRDNNIIYHDIKNIHKMTKLFPIIHYFVDGCDSCTNYSSTAKKYYGQRIFLTKNVGKITFNKILFSYLEKL